MVTAEIPRSRDARGAAAAADIVPMVLAAGHATRLRPLTDGRAKAVVPFLNRPLLDYTLDWLARCGFRRVVINLHHAAESIAGRYGRTGFGMRIDYSHEPVILGTAGGPRRAIDRLGEHVLLVNGDVLTLAPLGPLIRRHLESGAMATLGLYRGRSAEGYPRVAATADGRLVAFPDALATAPVEADVRGVFCGIHLLRREALELVPEGVFWSIVDALYRPLMAAGLEVAAVPLAGSWYEIGEPGRYIEHQLEALRLGSAPLAVASSWRLVEGGYLARHRHLETTRLGAPFLIGAGVRVKDGARVEASVLGDRVRVASGARLERVVAWEDAWIEPGVRLLDCVVMDGVRVAAGTSAVETVFTPDGPVPFGASTRGRP